MDGMRVDMEALNERIAQGASFIPLLKQEMNKVIVGQSYMTDRLLIALLGNGHILLEGVPGLAKTLAIKSLAQAIQVDFSRIQFTPDLLPADVVGTVIYNQKSESFSVKKGPIFANFVLADEINRAPAKVQSALLEAMQERQVTIGESTYPLPDPFMVLATQNPVEQEGTYPLPEAQSDRFLLKVVLNYPSNEEEQQIIRLNMGGNFPKIQAVVQPKDIANARALVREVYMDEKIERYIVRLVHATRKPSETGFSDLADLISFGASPRASIGLALASKAFAFIQGRGYVIPDDIRSIAADVMRHRIGLTYEAEAEEKTADDVVKEIINKVEVP